MVFKVNANDIAIENLTLTNSTPQGGSQAFALMGETAAKRFICYNAEVDSYQDTILMNTTDTTGYFKDSLIQGDVDFIWGGGNLFFTNCEIRSMRGNAAAITNPRTTAGLNGMSFFHCQVTRASTNFVNDTFGRSLSNPDGNAIFVYCLVDSHIIGWTDNNARYWTYQNSNLTATAALTYGNGTELTNGDVNLACAQDSTCWLNGWVPQLAPNILSSPTNLTVTPGQSAAFTVSATGIPEPSYQWLKGGTNLVGQTGATLNIPSADAGDAGVYSVIVSNGAGSVTSASATLTVILTPFQSWQQLHFNCTLCPEAAAGADPDGDGMNNQAEFLAGTDPNNAGSALRIISTTKAANDITVIWSTAGGYTNIVQATGGELDGSYSTNNFADIAGSLTIVPGSGDTTASYVDVGGATNSPSRYYRIRLVLVI